MFEMFNDDRQSVIDQIHSDIDTAQERLYEAAVTASKTMVYEPESSVELSAKRLEKLGFSRAALVSKAKDTEQKRLEKNNIIIKSAEQAKLITKYKSNYPFCKFLTVEEMDRICDKYSLTYAPVAAYTGYIPERNIAEIENAQPLMDTDQENDLYKLNITGSRKYVIEGMIKKVLNKQDLVFSITESVKIIEDAYEATRKLNGMPVGRNVPKGININTDPWAFTNSLHAIGAVDQVLRDFTIQHIELNGLFIAAPAKDFDLSEVAKHSTFGFVKVNTKSFSMPEDPIVFRYCKGGIQVISKWGLEAEDPALTPGL